MHWNIFVLPGRAASTEVRGGGGNRDWHGVDLVVGTGEARGEGKVVALRARRSRQQGLGAGARGTPQPGGVAGEICKILRWMNGAC